MSVTFPCEACQGVASPQTMFAPPTPAPHDLQRVSAHGACHLRPSSIVLQKSHVCSDVPSRIPKQPSPTGEWYGNVVWPTRVYSVLPQASVTFEYSAWFLFHSSSRGSEIVSEQSLSWRSRLWTRPGNDVTTKTPPRPRALCIGERRNAPMLVVRSTPRAPQVRTAAHDGGALRMTPALPDQITSGGKRKPGTDGRSVPCQRRCARHTFPTATQQITSLLVTPRCTVQ